MKVIRSKILPWPPVILAMMSLPQMISQMTNPISNMTIVRMILVMILRFLDTGFFAFFSLCFLFSDCSWISSFVVLAFSSPVDSSKLKT